MIEQLIRGHSQSTDRYCRLTPQGLEIQGASRRPALIPYATIREVNLQSLGAIAGKQRFCCGIRSWEHSRFVVDNLSFKGQNDSDVGDAAYRQFVSRLHRILKQQRVACRFTRGSAGLALIGWCLLSVLLIVSGASLLSLGFKALWLVGCMLPVVPYGVFLVHNSRHEDYAPEYLPPELLPAIERSADRAPIDRELHHRAEVAC